MKKYLISPNETFEQIFIVNAISIDKALEVFADFYALRDEYFIEDVYEKSRNMSFAEKFWLETEHERNHFMENSGAVLISEEQVKKRIKKYFGKKKGWATLFIEYYFSKFEDVVGYTFPDEMIKFLWLKEIDFRDLKIICIEEVEEINPLPLDR